MKRLFTIASLLLTTLAFSQGNFRFGLHFSPNIGYISPNENGIESDGTKLNFGFGLNAEFGLGTGENYALATGIGVTNMSGKLKSEGPGFSQEIDARYIDIPLAIKLKTNQIGYITYFGKFGLSNGVLIGADAEGTTIGTDFKDDEFHKQMIPFRSALLLGIGAEYNISGNTKLFFGIDFNNGFTGIFKKDDSGERIKASNSAIGLNLGVFF